MVAAAREIAAVSPCFAVKIPCTFDGIAAARQLEKEGIRTNLTLVFSPAQAIIAAKNSEPEEVKYEIADLLYHMMVLMEEKNISWEGITRELAQR